MEEHILLSMPLLSGDPPGVRHARFWCCGSVCAVSPAGHRGTQGHWGPTHSCAHGPGATHQLDPQISKSADQQLSATRTARLCRNIQHSTFHFGDDPDRWLLVHEAWAPRHRDSPFEASGCDTVDSGGFQMLHIAQPFAFGYM